MIECQFTAVNEAIINKAKAMENNTPPPITQEDNLEQIPSPSPFSEIFHPEKSLFTLAMILFIIAATLYLNSLYVDRQKKEKAQKEKIEAAEKDKKKTQPEEKKLEEKKKILEAKSEKKSEGSPQEKTTAKTSESKDIDRGKKSKKEKEEVLSQEKMLEEAAKKKPMWALGALFVSLILPIILFLFSLMIYFMHWQEEKDFFPPPTTIRPRWSILDLLRVFLFFWACQLFAMLLVEKIEFGLERTQLGILLSVANFLFIFAFILVLTIRWNGNSLRDLGFHQEQLGTYSYKGFLGYCLVTPVILISLIAITVLAKKFSWEIPQHAIQKAATDNAIWFFFLALFACVVAPIVEETFFRGFTYPLLKNYIGKGGAMFIVSAFFAILHGVHVFLPIFILGYFLVYLYEKTGSLIPSILVHSIHNGYQMAKLFMVQQMLAG